MTVSVSFLKAITGCDFAANRKDFTFMLKVKGRTGESVQQMVRRFKKLCEKEGLIRDIKRIAYYEKPSDINRRRKRKAQRTAAYNAKNY